jgi:hypothetical protein
VKRVRREEGEGYEKEKKENHTEESRKNRLK